MPGERARAPMGLEVVCCEACLPQPGGVLVNRLNDRNVRHAGKGVVLLGMFLGITACASSTGGSMASGNPDSITRAQIESLPNGSALTIIQQLRRRWLRARSQGTLSNPEPAFAIIFVDGRRWGDTNSLMQISSSEIEQMDYLNARDATTLHGTGYVGGIIDITTRRGR